MWGGGEVVYGARAKEGDVIGCFIHLEGRRAALCGGEREREKGREGACASPSERRDGGGDGDDVYAVRTLADMDSLSQGFFRYAKAPQPPNTSAAFSADAADIWSSGSFVQFFVNGKPQGVCVFNGGSDYLLRHGEYFPAISLLNWGVCTANFGPSFLFPPQKVQRPFLPACLLPVPRLPPLTVDVFPFLVCEDALFLDRHAKLLRPKTLADLFEATLGCPNVRRGADRAERTKKLCEGVEETQGEEETEGSEARLSRVVRRLAVPAKHLAQLHAGWKRNREAERLLESLGRHATLHLLHSCALFLLHAHRLSCEDRRREAERECEKQRRNSQEGKKKDLHEEGEKTKREETASGARRQSVEGESGTGGREAEEKTPQKEKVETCGEAKRELERGEERRDNDVAALSSSSSPQREGSRPVQAEEHRVRNPRKRRRRSRLWSRWRFGGVESGGDSSQDSEFDTFSSEASSVFSDDSADDLEDDARLRNPHTSGASSSSGALQQSSSLASPASRCSLCELAASPTTPQISLDDPGGALPSFFLPRASSLSPLLLAFLEREESGWSPVDAARLLASEKVHQLRLKRRAAVGSGVSAETPAASSPQAPPPAVDKAEKRGGPMKRGRGLRGEKGGAQGAGALRKLEEQKADLALRRFWGGRVYAADERETIQVGNVPLEVPAFWITGEAQEEFTSGDGGETNPGQREKLEGLENPQAATRDGRSPVSAGHAPGYGRDRKNDGSAVSLPRKRPAAKAQRPLAGSASGSELDCLGFLQSFLERQPERGVCAWREEDDEARALRHADCIMRKLGLRAVDILEGLGAKTQVYVHQSGLCQALVKWRQMGAKAQGFDPDEVKELASRFWLQQHACHLPL